MAQNSSNEREFAHESAGSRVFPCQDELLALFETLINVMFCMKDLEGRYIEVNSAFVRRTGRTSKREVVGAFARDLFIDHLAERYEEQDREVFATGQPLRDQLELIRQVNGGLGWYLTTKLPVSAPGDPTKLVGLVSVSRDLLAPNEDNIVLEQLQNVVQLVHDRMNDRLRVSDMAEVAMCSDAQLERRMRRVFGLTATQYVLRVRVEAAAALLVETDRSIVDIASACGFYDQPDFTRRFARLTNATPAQFRASHQ